RLRLAPLDAPRVLAESLPHDAHRARPSLPRVLAAEDEVAALEAARQTQDAGKGAVDLLEVVDLARRAPRQDHERRDAAHRVLRVVVSQDRESAGARPDLEGPVSAGTGLALVVAAFVARRLGPRLVERPGPGQRRELAHLGGGRDESDGVARTLFF